MILITGAAGKTGRAIIDGLVAQSVAVRAWVRREEQMATVHNWGAAEVIVGDLADAATYQQAVQNVTAIYHICPNMHPHEFTIGQQAIAAAQAAQVAHFVYHSVLHPQTEKMSHHWHKLRVEEALLESNLNMTVLQPAAYMQNIFGSWQSILEEGVYRVPYPVTTRLSLVDLMDVAETAVTVLTQPGHHHAIYELTGPHSLSPLEMAAVLSQQLNHPIRAEQISITQWQAQAEAAGLNHYALTTLTHMFDYYSQHHFEGNAHILRWLLGREPTDFRTFVAREGR